MILHVAESNTLYFFMVLLGAILGAGVRRRVPVESVVATEFQVFYQVSVIVAALLGASSVWAIHSVVGVESEGGRSLILALLFGWIAAEVLKRELGITRSTGDPIALWLPLTIAVGRLGCLFGHCCYGVPYGGFLALESGGRTYFPIPLVESLFHFCYFILLYQLTLRGRLSGQRMRLYAGSYAIFRFVTEYWRPYKPVGLGLTLYQWASLSLFCVIGVVVISEFRWRRT